MGLCSTWTAQAGHGSGCGDTRITRRRRTTAKLAIWIERPSAALLSWTQQPTPTPGVGVCAFFEAADRPATAARLLWDAQHDPSVLTLEASPARRGDCEAFDLARFASLATVIVSPDQNEHIVLSDGYRRLRMDIRHGTLLQGPSHLRYILEGLTSVEPKLLTLRRLLALRRLGRLARTMHLREPLAPRWIAALRAHDAVRDGASQRDIAIALYGERMVNMEWRGGSDFLRLRVQRTLRAGRYLATGGYRALLYRRYP